MKKFLIFVIVLGIGIYAFMNVYEKRKEEQRAQDYAKIEQLQEVCEDIVSSSQIFKVEGSVHAWHVYELGLIHQEEQEIMMDMEKDLGEDFATSLSNKDRLFVGFNIQLGKYRIYAGMPSEENMIYPDWNYTKLAPPTE